MKRAVSLKFKPKIEKVRAEGRRESWQATVSRKSNLPLARPPAAHAELRRYEDRGAGEGSWQRQEFPRCTRGARYGEGTCPRPAGPRAGGCPAPGSVAAGPSPASPRDAAQRARSGAGLGFGSLRSADAAPSTAAPGRFGSWSSAAARCAACSVPGCSVPTERNPPLPPAPSTAGRARGQPAAPPLPGEGLTWRAGAAPPSCCPPRRGRSW